MGVTTTGSCPSHASPHTPHTLCTFCTLDETAGIKNMHLLPVIAQFVSMAQELEALMSDAAAEVEASSARARVAARRGGPQSDVREEGEGEGDKEETEEERLAAREDEAAQAAALSVRVGESMRSASPPKGLVMSHPVLLLPCCVDTLPLRSPPHPHLSFVISPQRSTRPTRRSPAASSPASSARPPATPSTPTGCGWRTTGTLRTASTRCRSSGWLLVLLFWGDGGVQSGAAHGLASALGWGGGP
jgi:hypothetical protein